MASATLPGPIAKRLKKFQLTPLEFGFLLMIVSLPLGFHLNSLEDRTAQYVAGLLSGIFSIGLGLVLAYTFIDKFNERAEERKFRDVDAVSIAGLGSTALYLIATIAATLGEKQSKDVADKLKKEVIGLLSAYNGYFPDERTAALEVLMMVLGGYVQDIEPKTSVTEKTNKDFVADAGELVRQITDTFIPRILQGRISATEKEKLLVYDEGVRLNFSDIKTSTRLWNKFGRTKEMKEATSTIVYGHLAFLLQNCFYIIMAADRLQEGTDYRNYQIQRFQEGKHPIEDFVLNLGRVD